MSADGDWWRSATIYQVYPRSFADGERRRHRRPRRGARPPAVPAPTSASTRSGSPPGTPRRWPTAATTSPTTAPSTRRSARSPRPRPDRRGAASSASARASTSCPTTSPSCTRGSSEALAAGPGSPERERFWFRAGTRRGRRRSRRTPGPRSFGGPAWTRVTDADGKPGEGYLHLFAPEQPDLNWDHPDVRARARGRSCGSGSTAAWPASGSTRPPCSSRTRTLPEVDADGRRQAMHPYDDRDDLQDDLPVDGGAIADCYGRDRGARRRGLAAGRRALRPLPAPGRAAHGVQLRLHGRARGTPAALRDVDRRAPSPCTRRSAPRPPGCSPTTT